MGTPSVCSSVCGDGKKASSEECDDNNTDPNDGCSPTCMIEANGHCQHPNNNPSICDICGNGKRKPPETCDDGI